MPGNRSRTAKASLAPVALILFAAFVLSACVQSKKPLLAGSKPLLGAQFELNLYQDFIEGKPLSVKTSVFRWNGTHYSLVSGNSSGEKYFVIDSFGSNDLLIEAAYEADNVYLLARKQAKGTYRILPIDQNDVDEATRIRTCVTRNPAICLNPHDGTNRRLLELVERITMAGKGTATPWTCASFAIFSQSQKKAPSWLRHGSLRLHSRR